MGKHEDNGPPYLEGAVLVSTYEGLGVAVMRIGGGILSHQPDPRPKSTSHRLHAEYASKKKIRYFTSYGELRRVGGCGIAHIHRDLDVGDLWKKPR